jgi:hypothetical protein
MEQKNWLIRTRSMQILGPVQKSKILQLFKEGKIQPEDELCCGNGFWFYIREKKLVEKYLLGDGPQAFNPVSEAEDVVTTKMEYNEDAFIDIDAIEERVDAENELQVEGKNKLLAKAHQSKYEETKTVLEKQDIKLTFTRRNRITDIPARTSYIEVKRKGFFNDKIIYVIGVIFIIFTVLAYNYKEEIIKNFLKTSHNINFSPISNVYAQNESLIKKKMY